jgi:hypothetical protein
MCENETGSLKGCLVHNLKLVIMPGYVERNSQRWSARTTRIENTKKKPPYPVFARVEV